MFRTYKIPFCPTFISRRIYGSAEERVWTIERYFGPGKIYLCHAPFNSFQMSSFTTLVPVFFDDRRKPHKNASIFSQIFLGFRFFYD